MSENLNRIKLNLSRPDFELNVDLALPAHGISVLFGTSGSGKTSLLRCVAGLERASNSLVRINREVWQDDQAKLFLPTWRRPLGYVFQEASLFEHLDVQGNLHFGLQRNQSAAANGALNDAIELLGIGQLLKRRTSQLSGGERQRVAIARALATQPRLLLLDEPLTALDYSRRQDILPWLEKLRDELKIPMLYVTHSADEAARLANQLVLLERGQVKAVGPVGELMSAIASPLASGEDAAALLEGHISERDAQWHLARVAFAGGNLWLRDSGLPLGKNVRLRVMARDVSLASEEPTQTSIQNHLPCVIESISADSHPAQALLRLSCGESLLLARVTWRAVDALDLQAGKPVWAQVKSVALVE
jgi:molybdate transport system ATP-binding protein